MAIIAFDMEVMKYDWLLCAVDVAGGDWIVIHNDPAAVYQLMNSGHVLAGFNSKWYDNGILKAIDAGGTNTEVKEVNDWIIGGNSYWEHPLCRRSQTKFRYMDIKDDMYAGLSLKEIEGHLGMNIVESSIPWDLDRPLTQEELDEMIRYCKWDVTALIEIIKLRKDYLQTKMNLVAEKGGDPLRALEMTNAKLTAWYLGAQKVAYCDERDYEPPDIVDFDLIPDGVVDFFSKMYDPDISDEELFKMSHTELIHGVEVEYGFGGLHGSPKNYAEYASNNRMILNSDAESLYPSEMVQYCFTSRAIQNSQDFADVLTRRLEAKHKRNKQVSNDLKLILNTTYGAMLARFNDLYDPKMGRSICITGQLALTMLIMMYVNEVEDLILIDGNTDGVMISFPRSEYEKVLNINRRWESQVRLKLEEEEVNWVVKSDVNNYIASVEGKIKTKGGFFNHGIAPFGAWSVNNNMPVIKRALIEHIANGTPMEDVIRAETDIHAFQWIAKGGRKYSSVFHFIADEPFGDLKKNDREAVSGVEIETQKVNRVYASKDHRNGTLYKVHAETGRPAKIASLPEHCVIDNDNKLTIDDIDLDWYIEKAKSQLVKFLGG